MIKQTETLGKRLDKLRYLSRGIKENPKILDRRGLYQDAIEHLLRCCRNSIEHLDARFFKKEKQYEMNATKIDTKPSNKEAC